jgi:hypothetical protein
MIPQPVAPQAHEDYFPGVPPLAVFVAPPSRSDLLFEVGGVMIALAFDGGGWINMLASFPKDAGIRPARNLPLFDPQRLQTRRKCANWKTQSRAHCANAISLSAFD